MKWRNRITNYNFWISIVSAALLILQAFEFQFDIAYINEIATAVLGLLVVIGIISDPTKSYNQQEQQKAEAVKEEQKTETLKLPIKTEVETDIIGDEDNFKAVVMQISNDIDAKLSKLTEIQNLIIDNINSKCTEIKNETENLTNLPHNEAEQKPEIFNIVNN